NGTNGSNEGEEVFRTWSRKWPKYIAGTEAEKARFDRTTAEKWKAFSKSPPDRIGAGTIFWLADKAAPEWRDKYDASQKGTNRGGTPGFSIQSDDNEQTKTPPPDPLAELIPPDTWAAIKDPSKEDRGTRFWSIMLVLKSLGFTIDSTFALFERHPKGIAANYRGGLRHKVKMIWDQLKINDPKPTNIADIRL